MTGSVTELLARLRQGNNNAIGGLVKHFLPLLRRRLADAATRLRISDEDDIANSAFYELCTAVETNRFEDVSDRTQLWQVLSMLAVRKANDFRKFECAGKRGGNQGTLSLDHMQHQIADYKSQPELQMEMLERCDSLFAKLEDDDLRKVAELKIAGFANSEISKELGVAIRTVQLMVARIKEKMLDAFYD